MVPPSLMMRIWFFQFAVNIQNPRDSLGMIMMMALSTFLDLLLHQIYEMRELAQISFLREILQSMPLRELQYLLHPILVRGVVPNLIHVCGPDVICVVYINDLIFWSKDVPQINGVAMQLHKLGVDLEQEDNAAGFLGVTLDRDGLSGLLEMKQTGLIKRVIEALGLDDGYANGKHTPAESKPFVKDADGEGAYGGFVCYSSVVGMLLYLSGHT